MSARLSARSRRGDVVCRLGGDEFALIVEGRAPLSLAPLAEKIVAELQHPIQVGLMSVTVGCSVGMSEAPATAPDATTLVEQADAAMYQVKRHGKNSFAQFRPVPRA